MKKMLNNVKTLFVTCRQFGDTGKGKIVDASADWADLIARGNGGDNAGHTMCNTRGKLVTHLVPSGILYDEFKKINLICSGTVIYPKTLLHELEELTQRGFSYNNLRIAFNAKLITPAEVALDRIRESSSGKGKIGSTGKGIGPAYADVVDRQGLLINDLLNPDIFYIKLKRHLEYKQKILKNYPAQLVQEVLFQEHLNFGQYFHAHDIFDVDAIFEQYIKYGIELKPLISDTDSFIRASLGKLNILAEGAQGDLLSIKYGTYPYVTSSDCTVAGLAEGIGLTKNDVDLSLGIIKGFYMTRVGGGPFPTELGGQVSDDWCNGGKSNRKIETEIYSQASINDADNEFLQGVALRRFGDEYGATTGRPRRVGWLDLPLLRYVMTFNKPDIVLTKLDVLNNFKTIKICHEYVYEGPPIYYAGKFIENGSVLQVAIPDAAILSYCRPSYTSFSGWQCDLSGCTDFASLPKELKFILEFVVEETGILPRAISIGADREETIYL